jgi:phosphotransferase system enzyme I (PtsP)
MPASSAVTSARTILTRLHDVMASRHHVQAKLNTVVEVIGEGLDSEVCSVYLLREGMLELFATRGLAQEAVHVTRMAIGEGLVGTIAGNVETLNLAEAAAHPDFSYRPETGEDKYHSFAGVPIVRRERAVGVLCVQHVDPRRYEEVEIEALQTVAMVLSELIGSAGLVDDEDAALGPQQTGPVRLNGLALVKGLASGVAVYHQPRVTIEHVMAEDRDAERFSGSTSPSTRCANRSTGWPARPNSAWAESTRKCSRPTRCSLTTKAGAAGSSRRSTAA